MASKIIKLGKPSFLTFNLCNDKLFLKCHDWFCGLRFDTLEIFKWENMKDSEHGHSDNSAQKNLVLCSNPRVLKIYWVNLQMIECMSYTPHQFQIPK